jgi:lysophospholipase L1-like esterase
LLLVYYPLPSHPHHLDKLLFLLGGVLVWALWLFSSPSGLVRALNTRAYGRIRIVLINVLLFVIIGEATVRLADPILARDGLYSREESSQWLKPHVKTEGSIGQTNTFGFRDREWTTDKPASTVRVLAMGDSFTWGTGVSYDESVARLLERALHDRMPHSEILNLGVPGFEPEHELDLLKQFGMHLRPDAVLLNLFVGNDIMRKRAAGRESAVVVAGKIFYVHHSGNWIHDHVGPDRWYLYHNLNYLIRVDLSSLRGWFRRQRSSSSAVSGGKTSLGPSGWNLDYLKYLEERSDIFEKTDTEEWKFHWQFTRSTLDSFLNVLRAQRIPMVIAVIPEQVQLDRDVQREFLSVLRASTDSYDFSKPQRVLGEWCRSRGVACVDLLAKWKDGPPRDTLYFPNDTHWNGGGHARAAADIFPVLYAQLVSLPGDGLARVP